MPVPHDDQVPRYHPVQDTLSREREKEKRETGREGGREGGTRLSCSIFHRAGI